MLYILSIVKRKKVFFMADNSNITREDLAAVAYELYSSLCKAFDKPYLDPQGFEANCNETFKKFSKDYEE